MQDESARVIEVIVSPGAIANFVTRYIPSYLIGFTSFFIIDSGLRIDRKEHGFEIAMHLADSKLCPSSDLTRTPSRSRLT